MGAYGRRSSWSGCPIGPRLGDAVWPAPVPLFAVWRPNNENEAVLATTALADNQLAVTDGLLGDSTCGAPDFTDPYAQAGGWVLTPISAKLF